MQVCLRTRLLPCTICQSLVSVLYLAGLHTYLRWFEFSVVYAVNQVCLYVASCFIQ